MGSGPSLTASETGSDTSATRPPSQIRTNSSQSQSWFQSYFPQALLATRNPTSHAHIRPGPAAIERVLHFLTLKGLPVDLAEKVLDEAEYWSVCKRQCKQPMTIDARMPSPRVRATFAAASTMNQHAHGTGASGNGQEEELAWERSVPDNGLEERNGSAWVVVSGRIGCLSLRDSRRGNENGGMGHTVIDASSDGFDEDRKTIATGNELQRTRPMDSAYLRRVVIDTFSRDQGWSDHAKHYGTYESTFSWFEVALLREGKEVEGSRISIQNNVHAGQYFKHHQNTLEADHSYVKMAKAGDRVVLWARAEYPGWRNVVKESAITLYTSPFPPH